MKRIKLKLAPHALKRLKTSSSQSQLAVVNPPRPSPSCTDRHAESSALLSFPDGVQVLHDCADAEIDVCFIHGLTGNRESTWTADGHCSPWPQTLLPPELEKARILTYGYDSDIMRKSVAGSNRLIDHATNLLTDLTTDRASCNASNRSIIFVAHSLGGLVCKEAILLSRNHADAHLRGLFDHVKGVIFMGTPHKGSWMSKWARIPAATFGLVPKSNNMSLLTILQTDDQFLESIQVGFLTMVRELRESGRRLEITCFFEELPLHVVGEVVSKDSATFEGYNSISIHGNHSNMTKFGSVDDNGFKRVLGELQRWAGSERVLKSQLEEKRSPPDTSNVAKTFRARGLPPDWDTARLTSFLTEQLKSDDFAVHSLAQEFHGRSSTGTVHFPKRPSTHRIPLPSKANQPAKRDFIVLDDNFHGITTLYAPPPEDHKLDIVAISGLGGHAFGSFKERSGTHMWLRDSLPYDLTGEEGNGRPLARILVYGYESRVAESNSIQNLEDLATSFRTQILQIARPSTSRPIIFIAHSLGGLIVKQTLISLPKSTNEDDQSLLRRVYGIVFFGVPHDGMDISSLIPMVGDGPNRSLIDSLDRVNSQILTVQQRDFQTALGGEGKSEIICFYETLKSPTAQKDDNGDWSMSGPRAVLVTKSSATHCRPWETGPEYICAIQRSHSDMVKFGPQDDEYDKAVGVISSLARRALKARRRVQGADAKFLVPYNENPDFIGRSRILEQVKQQFGYSQCHGAGPRRSRVSLYGLGGVGKTQIALAYVYWLWETQPDVSVFWVHASNAQRFRQAYTSIAQKYNIPGLDDPGLDVLAVVKEWLEKSDRGRWLMVIDNADDTGLFFQTLPDGDNTVQEDSNLGRYIPECRHGQVLITTRSKQAGLKLAQGKAPIAVQKMDQSEAEQLVLSMLKGSEVSPQPEEILLLSSRLEYLPLALAQAAAFIQENTTSVGDYIQLLDGSENTLTELLSQPFETVGRDSDTPHAITATWIISFEQIQRQDVLASDVLSFISLLDRQAIPKEFVTHYCNEERPKDSRPIGPADIIKALGTLKAFCFVSEAKDQSLDLHRLVQLVTRKWLHRKNTIRQFAENALKTIAKAYTPGGFEYWEICSRYLPHAYAVLEHDGTGSRDEAIAKGRVQQVIALYYAVRGYRLKEADTLVLHVVETRKRVLGEDDPGTLRSMHKLASIYSTQGRWKEAEALALRVVETRKRVLGEEHPHTLNTLSRLAKTYLWQGRWKEAEALALRVVETRKRVLGEEHPHTLTTLNNLASTYSKQGRLEEAEALQLYILETRKRVLGEKHPNTLISMHDLAFTWQQQGYRQKAIGLLQKCIRLGEEVLGVDHPKTMGSLEILKTWQKDCEESADILSSEDDGIQIRSG